LIHFLVVQHSYSEFLGTIESQFEGRGIAFTYQRPFTGQALAGSAVQHDALWLLGGAHPVTDDGACPWIADELRLVAAFRQAKRPVVGIGFGGLVLARALGGAAQSDPARRAYWTTARRTDAGRGDPLADAVDGRRVLVMVEGSVDLPAGVAPILTDEGGEWIAARPDELSYAMVFRPELKPGMIEDMIMEEDRPLPENIGELLAQARTEWEGTQETTRRVVMALVQALDLMQERRKRPVFALNPVRREG
jgi:GMP synthase (glutamine-hydrolysing)